MLKEVTLDDIEPISIGAGILGTGGGGDPYIDSLHFKSELQTHGPQPILAPEALDDNATVAVVGYIGAPTTAIEKLSEGTELLRAIRLLEKHLHKRVDAIGIDEIGGGNAMAPLIAGRQARLPTVNGDGMGRAFPELPMTTFLFNDEIRPYPFALADAAHNEVVVSQTINVDWGERIARTVTVCMGATAGFASFMMTGAQFKAYCIPHTLTLAWQLGHRVLDARRRGEDVPASLAEALDGKVLLRGKISDVNRRTTGGFARGTLTIDGYGHDESGSKSGQVHSEQMHIEFQNEFLIAYLNGEAIVTVPDLICIVDEDGTAVATERLSYGMRVAVLGVPCAPQLKTERALQAVGPQAFGYEQRFNPLPGGIIGVDNGLP